MSKVTRIAVPYKKAAKEKKFYICVDCFVEKDSGHMVGHEKYFEDVEDLVEFCNEVYYEIPQLVYGVQEETIYISAENALEDACQNYNGYLEDFSCPEIDELQGILDAWVEKTARKYYTKDPTYIIDIWDEVKEISK